MSSTQQSSAHKPKARRSRRAVISRSGLVDGWEGSVFVHAEVKHGSRERSSMRVLEVRGDLEAPVKTVRAFKLTVFPESAPTVGAAEIPSVGSVISMRGCLDAVVTLSDSEFQLVTAMLAAGRLARVHLSFQEPKYGSGLIVSCSFSSRTSDEE